MNILNIDKKDRDYLYYVVEEDEKLRNFFCDVSFTYDRVKKNEEEELPKKDPEKEKIRERMSEKIEQIVESGICIDFYPEYRLNSYTWNQYYLSCLDDKVIHFNDFCFFFEDAHYLMDFVKEHKNSVAEPTPIFPTEKKYLLELEDKKGIIDWEQDLSKRVKRRKVAKKTYRAIRDKSSLEHCREMLKQLNEYEIMVGKLKKFKYSQLELISQYFDLVEELNMLDARKTKEETPKNDQVTRWERVFSKILSDKNKTTNFEYAELVLFKTLLKLHTYSELQSHKSYDKYQFNIDAVDEFLEYNSEKFNYAFTLIFDEPTIDETIKTLLKKY